MAMVEDTMMHPLVQQVLAGARRILAKKTKKKEPITPEILASFVEHLLVKMPFCQIICTITVNLLGFAGFFRFSELAN